VALVGGGEDPMFPKDRVVIWDDNREDVVAEIPFESVVLNVIFAHDRLLELFVFSSLHFVSNSVDYW
jgi:hypothetical protein